MKILFHALMQLVGLLLIGFPIHAELSTETIGREGLQPVAKMTRPRAVHQATLLDSGEVLVTGGCDDGCTDKLASAELWIPGKGFAHVMPMVSSRAGHSATRLRDGRVLLAGGWSDTAPLDSAEIFDPETHRFTPTGSMTTVRAGHDALALPDNHVLLIGGQRETGESLNSIEAFDPTAGEFSPAGRLLEPRGAHAAVQLLDGRILVTGGHRARRELLRSAEIFDPATGRSTFTGDMRVARHKHAAVLLDDGRVLVIGGSGPGDHAERHASTEIYDPATGEFSRGPEMPSARHKIRDAVVRLPSGRVLVAGNAGQIELLEPAGKAMERIGVADGGELMFAVATSLPGGNVLVTGGYDERIRSSREAWFFTPRQ